MIDFDHVNQQETLYQFLIIIATIFFKKISSFKYYFIKSCISCIGFGELY